MKKKSIKKSMNDKTSKCKKVSALCFSAVMVLSILAAVPAHAASERTYTVDVADMAITSVSSDEPEDAKGNGDGNGRVYTINFEVTDASGNTATGSYKVGVPHDQSGPSAVDDGAAAGYTVTYP